MLPPRLRCLLPALLAAACGSLPSPPPRTVPEAERLDPRGVRAYERALEERAAGDPAAALRALQPALEARPIHVPSHLLRQDLAGEAGGDEDLAAAYAALASSLPGDAGAAVLRARAAGGSSQVRIGAYQAAAVLEPASPWPRIALATVRSGRARELLSRADERKREGFPDESRALRDEARAESERACTEAEYAVSLAPGLAPARAARGHALAVAAAVVVEDEKERRRLRAAATDALEEALRLDPGDPRVLLARALLLLETGRGTEAQPAFDLAAAAAPHDAAVLAARARNLGESGRTREAADAWRLAAAAAPDDPEIRVDLGSALARVERWREALEEYRRADAVYARAGGDRWKAVQGIATALAQLWIEDPGEERLRAEALAAVAAYRESGGRDETWATRLEELLAERADP